jgi:hypothetical protein
MIAFCLFFGEYKPITIKRKKLSFKPITSIKKVATLKIDSTPIEGLDIDLVNQEFKKELGGYQCEVALAIGYQHTEDYNAKLVKSRRRLENILFDDCQCHFALVTTQFFFKFLID